MDDARAVTGCPIVNFNAYDPVDRLITLHSISGLEAYQRIIEHVQTIVPGFDPRQISVSLDASKWTIPTYLKAEVVDISWRQLTEGVLDDRLVGIAEDIAGLKRAMLFPIVVNRRVVGSLCFHRDSDFSTEDRPIFRSFTRQAALTWENAYLLAETRQSRQMTTAGEERLRREIAELLHSRVQSKLLVVWHRLGDVHKLIETDPEAATQLLSKLREELDRIREDDVREASHLLHPSIIRVGLIAAVRSLARRFEDYYRLSLDLNPRVVELDDPLQNAIPERARLVAYRVIEEALSNAYKHGHARLVELSIQVYDVDRLAIVVRDDGVGFDQRKMVRGLGLTSIADRIEQFDGDWEITGRPGIGTTLRAEFNFAPTDDGDKGPTGFTYSEPLLWTQSQS